MLFGFQGESLMIKPLWGGLPWKVRRRLLNPIDRSESLSVPKLCPQPLGGPLLDHDQGHEERVRRQPLAGLLHRFSIGLSNSLDHLVPQLPVLLSQGPREAPSSLIGVVILER